MTDDQEHPVPRRPHAYEADESSLPGHKPFPGMDPCIETTPNLWDMFHGDVIHDLRRAIADTLPRGWTATAERRARASDVTGDERGVRADVDILPTNDRIPPCPDVAGRREHAPHAVIELDPPRVPMSVLIMANGRPKPVTWIEVMSPSNKGGDFKAHVEKREAIRAAGIDYVEIDLLRAGKRTYRVADDDDFLVYVMHAKQGKVAYWPISMRDEMPGIRIPVGSGSIPVDLQAIIGGITDTREYRDNTSYAADLDIEDPGLAAWVERRMAPYR